MFVGLCMRHNRKWFSRELFQTHLLGIDVIMTPFFNNIIIVFILEELLAGISVTCLYHTENSLVIVY